ncbi:MAG: winged helix-turn-helix transcriptional regulator [Spirochaetales bacterium]|nr:winged helix-turn-helix transcriptional regulator [Spirochaetales bacterium]
MDQFISKDYVPKQTDGGLNEGLNEGLKSLLGTIQKKPGIQAKLLSVTIDRPVKTIERQIKVLIDKGLIEHRGSRKTGGYWVVEPEGTGDEG